MEALEGGAGERRLRASHRVPEAPPQPDTAGNRSCPRHWRTPRSEIFPVREKVLGPAFFPAQALSGNKAGFGAKDPILPDGVKDVAPGSVLLQNLLSGWTELEHTGSWRAELRG